MTRCETTMQFNEEHPQLLRLRIISSVVESVKKELGKMAANLKDGDILSVVVEVIPAEVGAGDETDEVKI